MSDLHRVRQAVGEHLITGEAIPHAAARMIGAFYHSGQSSLGYPFASTGSVGDTDALLRELFTVADDPDRDPFRDALAHYLADRVHRGETGPIEGWSRLWLES